MSGAGAAGQPRGAWPGQAWRGEVRVVPFVVGLATRFRRVVERSGVLLEGPAGWGEFSPFPEYPPAVAAAWAAAAREAAEVGWPAPRRHAIPVNAIVPAVDPSEAHRIVTASGCATAKVKVAEPDESLAVDLARCEAVRDALGPAGALRIDANAAWDPDTAVRAIGALSRFGLEYVEQPVADLADFAQIRRKVDVPLAADESIRTAADPLAIAGFAGVDVIVLKVAPLGGVRRALRVAEAATARAPLDVVVSSAVETSVGLAAGAALAAALPALPYACGLGTQALLTDDVTDTPCAPVRGQLTPTAVQPDPARLAAAAPDPARAAALLARFDAAEAAGGVSR